MLLYFFVLFASVAAYAEPCRNVNAHLLIGDEQSAIREASFALQSDPYNRVLNEVYIKALAKAGEEKLMCKAFSNYSNLFECHPSDNRDLFEVMAWGVIISGEKSSSPIVRLCSLLAAFFGEDAKSVRHLLRACSDSNSAVRSAAVQLISHLHDAPLCDEVMRLYSDEKVWTVRLQVIKAIGKMRIKSGRPALVALVADVNSGAEEKAAAIKALVNLLDDIDRQQIVQLSFSDRAGLRLLACEFITHLQSERDIDLLWNLSSDGCFEVRAAALRSIGLLDIKQFNGHPVAELAKEKCRDFNVEVAITAAWLLSLHDPESSISIFSPWLQHKIPEVRLKAAAALAATGYFGTACMQEFFYKSTDPGVKINLALGLIQQGLDILPACDVLYNEFTIGSKRWYWDEEGSFRALLPLTSVQSDGIIQSLEETYQLTRLEILNLLSVLKYPKAQEAIQNFLSQKMWGISGLATVVLLTEGDQDAMGIVENILDNSSANIKVHAALILALWGRGERAITLLEESYPNADRDTKEKILEGIGRIGAISSLPFLVQRLQDPQQTLRLIAASAILQCLYH